MNERGEAVIDLLTRRGAGAVDHPGGNLLDHLRRTGEVLASWGSRQELVLAGLAHAAYGTDGFDVALFDLEERDVVADAVGPDAEAIVHRYASCDRRFTLPRIGTDDMRFRDRFTGVVSKVDRVAVTQFAELTMANELDLLRHSEAIRRESGPAICALFAPWQDVVGPAAFSAFEEVVSTTGLDRGDVPVHRAPRRVR